MPYKVHPINIGQGEQFKPEFLKVAPNNRIPAIVDHEPADGGEPISLFESGAILLYLAEKTGQFIPEDVRGRQEVLQWLFWQMGGQIGRASCRERVCQYVWISVVAVSLKTKKQ